MVRDLKEEMKGIGKAEVGEGKCKKVMEKEEVIGVEPCFLCQDVERNGICAVDFYATGPA